MTAKERDDQKIQADSKYGHAPGSPPEERSREAVLHSEKQDASRDEENGQQDGCEAEPFQRLYEKILKAGLGDRVPFDPAACAPSQVDEFVAGELRDHLESRPSSKNTWRASRLPIV